MLEVTKRARIVALAVMTIASLVTLTEAFYPDETARVVASIVTGIGFLGAGDILRISAGEVNWGFRQIPVDCLYHQNIFRPGSQARQLLIEIMLI